MYGRCYVYFVDLFNLRLWQLSIWIYGHNIWVENSFWSFEWIWDCDKHQKQYDHHTFIICDT